MRPHNEHIVHLIDIKDGHPTFHVGDDPVIPYVGYHEPFGLQYAIKNNVPCKVFGILDVRNPNFCDLALHCGCDCHASTLRDAQADFVSCDALAMKVPGSSTIFSSFTK